MVAWVVLKVMRRKPPARAKFLRKSQNRSRALLGPRTQKSAGVVMVQGSLRRVGG